MKRDDYLIEAKKIFKEIGAKADLRKTKDLLGGEPELEDEDKIQIEKIKEKKELSGVYKISQMISSILDLDKLLDKIIDSAIQITRAERGFLLLYPETSGEGMRRKMEIVVSHDVGEDETVPAQPHISWEIIEEVINKKETKLILDASTDINLKDSESIFKYGIKSILCAPLIMRGVLLGVIYLDNRLLSGLFEEGDSNLLKTLSAQAAISIQNARLYTKAATDGLTGLYNHEYFQNQLNDEINKANKAGGISISILMIDIDLFKNFNDTYGHQAGDEILKGIAKLLKKEIGERGFVARYGGEEMAVVLPKADLLYAKNLAEEIRRKVEKYRIPYKNKECLFTTVSIGVAELGENMDRLTFIEKADKALYKAKNNGRNRVEI